MSEIQIPQHYWVTEPLASLDPFRVGVIDSAATLNGLKKNGMAAYYDHAVFLGLCQCMRGCLYG